MGSIGKWIFLRPITERKPLFDIVFNSAYIKFMPRFTLSTAFKPSGDQPQAIEMLSKGIESGHKHQVLLGVTGSGKTFTMANVISRVEKTTLVIAPNKPLAAPFSDSC